MVMQEPANALEKVAVRLYRMLSEEYLIEKSANNIDCVNNYNRWKYKNLC